MRLRSTRPSHSECKSNPRNASNTVDFSRTYLRQVVSIHQAMFEKLLFDEQAAVGQDLAELFQDAGKTYLQIAERISESCLYLQD